MLYCRFRCLVKKYSPRRHEEHEVLERKLSNIRVLRAFVVTFFKVLENKTFNTIFQENLIKINQQSYVQSSQFHVGEYLCFMNFLQFIDTF